MNVAGRGLSLCPLGVKFTVTFGGTRTRIFNVSEDAESLRAGTRLGGQQATPKAFYGRLGGLAMAIDCRHGFLAVRVRI